MTIIRGRNGFKVEGDLASFQVGSEQVIFDFKYGISIEIKGVSTDMSTTLTQLGLAALMTADIDLSKATVTLPSSKATKKK